jgi:hypothetical protein
MPRFVAVSREGHEQKKWRRYESYTFAAADALAPIVVAELANAMPSMPLAFSEQSGGYTLVAVLSLSPARNMFVGADGRWLGRYVPSWFRGHPFRMFPQQGTDKLVLCVDEESGLVVERSAAGEEFFDPEGNPSPALKSLFEFLMQVERSRRVTDLAVAALAEAGVIRPWQIKLKTKTGQGEQAIGGLHHIDEVALSALPDDVFLKLRKTAAALPITYAQMLSAAQLGIFEHLDRLQKQAASPSVTTLPETIDSLFEMPGDDVIRF